MSQSVALRLTRSGAWALLSAPAPALSAAHQGGIMLSYPRRLALQLSLLTQDSRPGPEPRPLWQLRAGVSGAGGIYFVAIMIIMMVFRTMSAAHRPTTQRPHRPTKQQTSHLCTPSPVTGKSCCSLNSSVAHGGGPGPTSFQYNLIPLVITWTDGQTDSQTDFPLFGAALMAWLP